MQGVLRLLEATQELNHWATDTGQRLPLVAEAIAMSETVGVVVDLERGEVFTQLDDEVQTLDDHLWLADLEAACDGNVSIAWAVRPEDYFAALEAEAQKRA